jgi:hypothetical protein
LIDDQLVGVDQGPSHAYEWSVWLCEIQGVEPKASGQSGYWLMVQSLSYRAIGLQRARVEFGRM